MLQLVKSQVDTLILAIKHDFIDRLVFKLRAEGFVFRNNTIADYVENSIHYGLITELAASTYVTCIIRLQNQQIDVSKVQRLAMREDIDSIQKIVALTMLTERLELMSQSGEGGHHHGR